MENRLGLIAGNGRFPLIFAESARKKGVEIIAIGINEETSRDLEKLVTKIYWLGVGELGKLFEILMKEKLSSIVMAGQVKHRLIFDKSIKVDQKMQSLLERISDKKTDSIIGAVADKLECLGVRVLSSLTFLSDHIAEKGVLTRTMPDERILKDIEFGRLIAKTISGLDIGQTVVVKDMAVLAVESIEGTNEAIKRGALYGKEGIVAVKVSKPKQDMRFDVPVIGPDTIRLLKELKAACIAIEAGKTLIIDKPETIKLADESGVIIAAV